MYSIQSLYDCLTSNIYKICIYLDRRGIFEYNIEDERRNCMTITSDIIRGHTDTIILAHLEEHDSYGYQINKSIQERTGYILKDATLYTAFRRLEDLGYITSYWGDGDSGARRRYYTITGKGRQALAEMKNDWRESKKIIDKLINMEE